MKKKEMLKQQKKIKEENNRKYLDFSDKSTKLGALWITLGVIAFIALTYFIINLFNGNISLFSRKNTIVPEIDNSKVVCGTMFNRTEEEYYVLAYYPEDKNNPIYDVLVENYSGTTKLYTLNLNSGFNKTCIGETTNITNDLNNLKISNITLIHIKNGNVSESFQDTNKIKEILK